MNLELLPSATARRVLIACVLAASAHAQSVGNPPATNGDQPIQLSAFEVSTSADRGYRAGNSVSATRVNTPIKDLPFAINAFTSQFITDIGATDLFDIVRYAPGVTSNGLEFTGGNAVYNIRGFNQTPERNGFVGTPYVDPVNIERVEVVKGPAAVLYGQVGPGGTVNYITKRATEHRFDAVTLSGGSYDFARVQLDSNQPIVPGRVLARFNGAWENGLQNIDPTGNTSSQTFVADPTVTLKLNDRVTLISDYEYFHRRENAPVYMKAPLDVGGLSSKIDSSDLGFGPEFPGPASWNYASRNDWRKSTFQSLNEELDITLSPEWTARANYSWNQTEVIHKLTGIGSVNLVAPAGMTPGAFAAAVDADPSLWSTAASATLSRRARLEDSPGQGNAYQVEVAGDLHTSIGEIKPLLGAYYRSNTSEDVQRQIGGSSASAPASGSKTPPFPAWNLFDPSTIDYNTDFNPDALPTVSRTQNVGRNGAVYAVVNGSFLDDRLIAVAGLRVNKARALSNNLLKGIYNIGENSPTDTAPQFGLGYKVRRDLLLYASYSEGFVVNNSSLEVLNVPTGPARPTTSRGYDVGVKTDFLDGRISSTLSAYQIEQFDNIQSFNVFLPNGTTAITTTQGAVNRSRGVEGEITFSPTDELQIYASASIDDVRVTSVPDPALNIYLNSHPEGTVRTLANLWARYNLTGRLKGAWLGGGLNYTGRKAQRLNNPYLFLPAYTLYDVTAGYDWKSRGTQYSATLALKNLTNEEYFPADQERGLPLRLVASVTARF
ncbi:MAG TPA: TonB-dependent receptor [Opitutaceae bacterium]|nr:TonB-dependent receptor [Opitutaceae bacterium]